jgi:hypothetical protein
MQRLRTLIDQFHDLHEETEEPPSKAFQIQSTFDKKALGWGKLVKTLRVPSDGDFVYLLSHVNLLLPRLKTLHSYHPPHDQSKVPTLSPELLSNFQSFISSAQTLIIEDISKPIWHGLLSIVSRHGINLRHIDVEATGELEPFFSRRGIFSVLAKATPNLECLRVDGISVGLDKHVDQLVQSCTKLRAVTVDYCYGITIQAFITLWNGLPNLEFIGFAGIIGPLPEDVRFELRPKVKTIRFVDCDVSDEFVRFLALVCMTYKSLHSSLISLNPLLHKHPTWT